MVFDWVKPLGETGMYLLFGVLGLSFLMMMLGWFYRLASISAFVIFTYIELIDKTNYLNHYYFVSLVCLLMIFLPADRYFSLSVWLRPQRLLERVPRYVIAIVMFQLSVVYFYAGVAKLNTDWLVHAQPLKIWLPAHSHLPVIGPLLTEEWVAYAFSWFGAFYDLTVPFFLLISRTRPFAYIAVIVFHTLTWILFPIGMFPFIMMGATLIFFPAHYHQRVIKMFQKMPARMAPAAKYKPWLSKRIVAGLLVFFVVFQLAFPMRYLLYPGHLFWTEEGYRFGWRVMLMEKAGYAIFHVTDPESGRKWEAKNYDFLTPNQEKMMATQPDMILQFAHFLEDKYEAMGFPGPGDPGGKLCNPQRGPEPPVHRPGS